MPFAIYLVPVTTRPGRPNSFVPKHFDNASVDRWGAFYFSNVDSVVFICTAPQATLDAIAADADSRLLADESNLDAAITGGQRGAFVSILESLSIPGGWVQVGMTRREAIRILCRICNINKVIQTRVAFKKLHADLTAWVDGGGLTSIAGYEDSDQLPRKEQYRIVAKRTWAQLPTGVRNYLLAVRDEQGWTNEQLGIGASSTVGQMLKAMDRQPIGLKARMARHGLTFSTKYRDLPAGFQNELQTAAEQLGVDPSAAGLTGNSTITDFFYVVAETISTDPVSAGGVTI